MMKIELTILLIAMSISFLSAQENITKDSKKETEYQKTASLLQSGQFVFEANKTFSYEGRVVDLTTNPNYVKVMDENVKAHLPFFGETYKVIDMSGGGGINFEGKLLEYEESYNDEKQQVDIKFKVNTPNDNYSCFLNVSYSGRATLSINCTSKSHARYTGEVHPIKNN